MNVFQIFKDNNNYDEKNIIGFASFIMMSIIGIIDTITAILGVSFEIHEYIYDSFVTVTLGAFGISEIGKIAARFQRKKTSTITPNNEEKQDEEPPETY